MAAEEEAEEADVCAVFVVELDENGWGWLAAPFLLTKSESRKDLAYVDPLCLVDMIASRCVVAQRQRWPSMREEKESKRSRMPKSMAWTKTNR